MSQSLPVARFVAGLVMLSVVATGVAGAPSAGMPDPKNESGGAADVSSDVTSVSECREIAEPGYYQLSDDLLDREENVCIWILASDVVFDGAGHRIDGVGEYLYTEYGNQSSTKGLEVSDGPFTNVTIRNVEVTDYGYGIWMQQTEDSRIVNSTFRNNGIYGIYLGYAANNNTVADNVVVNTTSGDLPIPGQAIVLANIANGNVIVDNYVEASEDHGIAVHWGDRNRIENNTIRSSGRHGITGVGDGTVIVDNVIERSGEAGIFYAFANGTRIEGNDVRDAPHGIVFGQSSDAVISGNRLTNTDEVGIRLHGIGEGTVVRRNVIDDSADWDIDSNDHMAPITVVDLTLGTGSVVSFTGHRVAVSGASMPPAALPEGFRPASDYLRVMSHVGEETWLEVTLPYEDADEADSIDLWVYRQDWRRLPRTAVERGPAQLSTNLTGFDRPIYLVAGVGTEATPTAEPSRTPEPTPESTPPPVTTSEEAPGFGFLAPLVALLLAGLFARERRA